MCPIRSRWSPTSSSSSIPGNSAARWRRYWFEEARINRAYPAWLRREPPPPPPPADPVPISVVMPVHETPAPWLRAAIDSVRAQTWPHWELCIADDASAAPHVPPLLAEAAADPRVRVVRLPTRQGIAAATNEAAALATGAWLAFLDHDDVLAPAALATMAAAAGPGLGLLFSDEDQLAAGRRRAPYFKPGWNPDLLLQQNYVSHLMVCRKAVFDALGGMRGAYDGAQDHDFALRAWRHVGDSGVRHVPAVLYHWRQDGGTLSARARAQCADASMRAVRDCLGDSVALDAVPDLPGWFLSRFAAETDALLFVAPDLEPAPGAVAALLGQVAQPGVGAAGGRIEDRRGRLLHGGYRLDRRGAAVPFRAAVGDPGYRGRFRLARTVAAVSREAMAVRRELFDGWREDAGEGADVDLCLRLAAAGWRTVWTPAARFVRAAPPAGRGSAPAPRWGRRPQTPGIAPTAYELWASA